jgi:hypothetical protein
VCFLSRAGDPAPGRLVEWPRHRPPHVEHDLHGASPPGVARLLERVVVALERVMAGDESPEIGGRHELEGELERRALPLGPRL